MTTYRTIADTEIDTNSPVVTELMAALRDNTLAIREGDSSAPKLFNGWQIEDGATGVNPYYGFATDGAVASAATPDFTDGYEYALFLDAISGSSAGTADLIVDLYLQTAAAYFPITIATGITAGTSVASGLFLIPIPRVSKNAYGIVPLLPMVSSGGGGPFLTAPTSIYAATSQKTLRARVRFSAGNIDAGRIWLFKRGTFL